jgi:hypothetical protein
MTQQKNPFLVFFFFFFSSSMCAGSYSRGTEQGGYAAPAAPAPAARIDSARGRDDYSSREDRGASRKSHESRSDSRQSSSYQSTHAQGYGGQAQQSYDYSAGGDGGRDEYQQKRAYLESGQQWDQQSNWKEQGSYQQSREQQGGYQQGQQGREHREHREHRENREHREHREQREQREHQGGSYQVPQDGYQSQQYSNQSRGGSGYRTSEVLGTVGLQSSRAAAPRGREESYGHSNGYRG